MTRRTTY